MSKTPLRYDGKVAIVTGGGNGLGREYALFFGTRGAKVVVNDLGGSHTGTGASSAAAQKVCDEIKALGGTAVPNFDSVEFGDKIVKTAIDAFGRVDIIINNAGILRDVSFQKMTDQDWDLIMKVHMKGTFSVTRAAWNYMKDQGYGRIINTSSSSGIYGNFGQANYSAAKLGIHGFTNTLAKEGEKRNIRVNTIAPQAASRMTATVMPEETLKQLDAKHVVPLVGWLAHEDCQETGGLFESAAGVIVKLRWQASEGHSFDLPFTVEDVRDNWDKVIDFNRKNYNPSSGMDLYAKVVENINRINEKKSAQSSSSSSQGGATNSGPALKSDELMEMFKVFVERGEAKPLTKKVNATFTFSVLQAKGGPVAKTWFIDLKNGDGACSLVDKDAKADAGFTMVDDDFMQLVQGKLNAQQAFMTGKMKIKGNMAAATKFTPDLFPAYTPENLQKYKKAKL